MFSFLSFRLSWLPHVTRGARNMGVLYIIAVFNIMVHFARFSSVPFPPLPLYNEADQKEAP